MPLMGRVPLGYSAERWLSALEKLNTYTHWVYENIGVLRTRRGRGLRGKLRARNGGTESALYQWLKTHDIRARGGNEAGRKLKALDAIVNAGSDAHLRALLRRHQSLLGLPPGATGGRWGQMTPALVAPPRRRRSPSPWAGSPASRARVEEGLLGDSEVAKSVRDFYVAMRTRKALPQSRESLGQQIKGLKRGYRIFVGEETPTQKHRALHEKEVRLLALLHDAGLPVLGGDRLGVVEHDKGRGTWRWKLAGVVGDEKASEAMALEEQEVASVEGLGLPTATVPGVEVTDHVEHGGDAIDSVE